ncbi:MAG: DNA polymerase III subunit gamma/tau [Planctomycetota bacterium]
MAYLVFARKYRPQTFDAVVGQDHVVVTLQNAIREKRVAHAYMFVGPKGTGKTSMARILVKALNCASGPTPTPCGTCPQCVDITAGSDMDVIEIDGASNRGIDDIKALRENVKFAPARARFKVYIIDEVHMLTPEANNALLKTLEEPPAHVKFIFATTEPHKVIATVFSRCQRFDFRLIPFDGILGRLKDICAREKLKADPEVLAEIARAAEGGMRDSQSILDQVVSYGIGNVTARDVRRIIGSLDGEVVRRLGEAALTGDAAATLRLVNGILDAGVNIGELTGGILVFIRNAIMFRLCGEKTDLLAGSSPDDLAAFKRVTAAAGVDRLLLTAKLLEDFLVRSRGLACARMLLELTLVNVLRVENFVGVAELLERSAAALPAAEKKTESPGAVPAAAAPAVKAAAPAADENNDRRFFRLVTRENSLLGATLRAWNLGLNRRGSVVDLDTADGVPLDPTSQALFRQHPEWSAALLKAARTVYGPEVTVTCAFQAPAGRAGTSADGEDGPRPDPDDEFGPVRPESVSEMAERVRRDEPVVDQIINLFHGNVLKVREK